MEIRHIETAEARRESRWAAVVAEALAALMHQGIRYTELEAAPWGTPLPVVATGVLHMQIIEVHSRSAEERIRSVGAGVVVGSLGIASMASAPGGRCLRRPGRCWKMSTLKRIQTHQSSKLSHAKGSRNKTMGRQKGELWRGDGGQATTAVQELLVTPAGSSLGVESGTRTRASQ
jgi:hypothetical protein